MMADGRHDRSTQRICNNMASEFHTPFLPFEVIIDILKWLPMKSIVRFQCVCKQWKKLFKTQSFISQHALHSARENPFLLIKAIDYNYRRSTLRLLDHKMETVEVINTAVIDSFRHCWRIIGSSNGLLCVELGHDRGKFPISYLLWNPVINEVIEVPQILNDYCGASVVGFGYSSVVNDCKIVRFYHPHLLEKETKFILSQRLYCVQVYSLRTGSWKELEMGDLRHVEIHAPATNVNGTIFWKGHGMFFEMLIAFDIAKEEFTITPIDVLSANVGGLCPPRLFEYGNKLAMCEAINFVRDDSESFDISMWVIEEGASESGKSYSCTQSYRFGPIIHGLRPWCIWRDEIVCRYELSRFDITRAELDLDEKNYLYLFNLNTKEWKKFPNFSCAYDRCSIFKYEKSLVSVCST